MKNSTQRGNENFGAVLDSVGAVLVQCVKDVYDPLKNISEDKRSTGTIKGNLEKGEGLGRDVILAKEPSLQAHSVQSALSVFRKTDAYLKLLKKGGLPEQFHHLFPARSKTLIVIQSKINELSIIEV